jgi:hypothetical protein
VTGTTNGVAATTDVFQLTGVILLAGPLLPTSALSPLLMRPFDQEQRTCQRYCVAIRSGNLLAFGKCYLTTAAFVTLSLPAPLRIDPVVTLSAASDFNLLKTGATSQAVTSLLASAGGIESAILQLNLGVASGLTVDMATAVQRANSNAVILINARLLG